MITASVSVNSNLVIEPSQYLVFSLDHTPQNAFVPPKSSECTAEMRLDNIDDHKYVIFKIRTTNPDMFIVKPAHGMIPPLRQTTISITLIPKWQMQLAAMSVDERRAVNERFLVQSIDKADGMLRESDIHDYGAFWKRLPRDWIHDYKLSCRFTTMNQYASRPRVLPRREPTPTLTLLEPDDENQAMDQAHWMIDSLNITSPHAIAKPPVSSWPPPLQANELVVDQYPDAGRSSCSSSSSSSDEYDDSSNQAQEHEAQPLKNLVQGLPQSIDPPEEHWADLFSINPSDSLHFTVTSTSKVLGAAQLQITNKSLHHGLAFKVKLSNHNGYYVKPNPGVLACNQTQTAQVIMWSKRTTVDDIERRQAIDKFLVEVLFVDRDLYEELIQVPEQTRKQHIAALWKNPSLSDRTVQTRLRCTITLMIEDTSSEITEARSSESKPPSLPPLAPTRLISNDISAI